MIMEFFLKNFFNFLWDILRQIIKFSTKKSTNFLTTSKPSYNWIRNLIYIIFFRQQKNEGNWFFGISFPSTFSPFIQQNETPTKHTTVNWILIIELHYRVEFIMLFGLGFFWVGQIGIGMNSPVPTLVKIYTSWPNSEQTLTGLINS